MAVTKLVLVRHGESQWNNENRFTGWYDVDLSEKGVSEAKAAGKLLKAEGFSFDFAYTSVLKRAIHTLWNVLDELDQAWLPVEKSWKLNERHYGALQRVIIAAHGNSLRALVKYLDNMGEDEILELNIPTGVPLVYEFDENFKPIKHYYLGNAEEIAAKAAAVANQGKAK